MIDTRCWSCAVIDNKEGTLLKAVDTEYKGKGIFKCPECKEILDLSDSTFMVDISRVQVHEDGWLITEFIKHDERIEPKNRDGFEEDIYDLFNDLPAGKYRCEVYMQWSKYGYEGEWDLETCLFSEEELEVEVKTEAGDEQQ